MKKSRISDPIEPVLDVVSKDNDLSSKKSTSPESSKKETNMSPKLLPSSDFSNNQPTNVVPYSKTAFIGPQNDTVDLTEDNAELGTVNSTIPNDNDKVPPA